MDIMNQRISRFYKIGEINKSTIWAFFSILLYKLILDLSYYFIISKVWSYAKFGLHLSSIKLVESYFLLLMISVLMPKSSTKLSNIMVWLLILLSYIPMLTLFGLKDESRIFMYSVTGFWLIVFLLLQMSSVSLPSFKQGRIILFSLFVLLSLIVFLMIYRYLGLSVNFDLTKVYEIRTSYVKTGIPLAGYLFNWLGYIVNPLFFALFCIRRKWIFAGLTVSLELLLFSNTGNKTFLFALPFVLALIWIITRKHGLACTAIGLVGLILLGMLSYWSIGDVWISSLFVRRTMLVPALLSFFYYDFFSNNNYTFLSQHCIFRTFLDYPYHLEPPHLIAEVYFNKPQMSANTGVVGDAYMNLGFAGLFLWAVLLAVILKLIDNFSRKKDMKIAIAGIAMPTIALTNSALLTNILTHGLLLSLLLLYLLPKNETVRV